MVTANSNPKTIAEKLHASATHKKGSDPNCPVCYPLRARLRGIITRLQACARQNDSEPSDDLNAHAVAGEQWRMVKILKDLDRDWMVSA